MKVMRVCAFALLFASVAFCRPQEETNDIDEQEEEEEFEIGDIPNFISAPMNVSARPGTNIRLTCQVSNMNVPLMWSRVENGKTVVLALGDRVFASGEDASRFSLRELDNKGGQSLTIFRASKSDAGEYLCQVMSQPPKSLKFIVTVDENVDNTPETTVNDDGKTEAEGKAEEAAAAAGGSAKSAVLSLFSVAVFAVLSKLA